MSALSGAEVCVRLSEWADAAGVVNADGSKGHLAVVKSCLLSRLMYGGEHPSKTPCPVHKGRWSGVHNWSSNGLVFIGGVSQPPDPANMPPQLRDEYDAGCRCAFHKGCNCTTGWQPDAACGCRAPLGETVTTRDSSTERATASGGDATK